MFNRAAILLAAVCLAAVPARARPAVAAPAPANRVFADSKLVTTDRLSVEVVGRGADVVLIPGLASSREVYRRTAERLRGRYRLHLVQVAGFAGEPARANAAGPVLMPTTEAIADYIAQAGLKKPAIVGHSLGGLMALMLAVHHPDCVGKAMIVDTLAFYTQLFAGPQATAASVKPMADGIGAQMLAASDADYARSSAQTASMMATAPADQAMIQRASVASARATMVKAMQEDMTTDLRAEMASIPVPITVFYEAPLAKLIAADYAPVPHRRLIAAAPSAKHFLMLDDPAGFDAALDGFLKS